MSEQEGSSLVLEFDTDSPEFARGLEIGSLLAVLGIYPGACVLYTMHISNTEMVLRVAEALDRSVSSVETDEFWMDVSFGPVGSGDNVRNAS